MNWLTVVLLVSIFYLTKSEEKDWWQKTIFYQIYPRSFKDSNGDGIGDLNGITEKLSYLKETGIDAAWLSPIFESPMVDFGYDVSNYRQIQPEYGTLGDFDRMISRAHELGVKIILDFVPNHTSDQAEWFIKSAAREAGYEDYYVWANGHKGPDGELLPPNNWVSVFYGSAWTYHPGRKQFYLHQFTKEQPDLNFRSEKVVEEMKEILRFWLAKGVSGFRVDAVNHLFEDEDLQDEPVSNKTDDSKAYDYLEHTLTTDLPECYEMVKQWRELLDNWSSEYDTETKIMMTEAYANLSATIQYYNGAQIPFNFLLITDLNQDSTAADFVYTINKWLTYMPVEETANWVMGNHDKSRVGSRFNFERIDIMNTLLLTLPGIAITYNGEEIGMTDYTDISWEETKDPAALNTNPEVYRLYSRDPVRTPFQWDSTDDNAGFTTGNTTWLPVSPNYRALNLQSQQEADLSHYKLYQQLAKLRQHKTFLSGNFRPLVFGTSVFAYVRELPGSETFVIVLNIGSQREIVNLNMFLTLPEELEVLATGIRSTYNIGSIVSSNELRLGNYEALVLKTNGVFACNYSAVTTTTSQLSAQLP